MTSCHFAHTCMAQIMKTLRHQLQLVAEIEDHRGRDFKYIGLKHVFLRIAKCANGVLENAYIPKMINNPDEDSDNEDDLNSDKSDNESDDSDDESNDDVTDPPAQKRQ